MKINNGYLEIEKLLEDNLKSDDIEYIDISLADKKGMLIFVNNIVDKKAIGDLILSPISKLTTETNEQDLFELFLSPEKKKVYDSDEVMYEVLNGNCVLMAENLNCAFSFGLQKFDKRAITEPPTSTVIKGPREGFVESLSVNLGLLRRRIKSKDLKIEQMSVGKFSNTPVALCYIDNVADNKLVDKIRKKLQQIDIDTVLDSSYVAKKLSEHKTGIFKQLGNTEKPDILSAKILEGRVALFVDGSPIALTVPYLLIEDFQSPSDYYNSSYSATFTRLIRLFSVIFALLLPSIFVSAELFHLQLIPLSFLLTIVNSIKGIPLSPSYEMFFTLLIFEILNETSVRMPKYVGMVVSIVGGLVLGETAVTAGIISAPTLMIIAFSGICLYTVPELVQNFSILRLMLLIVSGSFGIYAMLCTIGILIVYLISYESFGTPLCAPYSPLVKSDLKDGFIKSFEMQQDKQPISLMSADKRLKVKRSKYERTES